MISFAKKILGKKLSALVGRSVRALKAIRFFWYDYLRFVRYSGFVNTTAYEARRARIIMAYHVVEKGLTMPNRRMAFGKSAIGGLIKLINDFVEEYGIEDEQVKHSVGVIKEYYNVHVDSGYDFSTDVDFWNGIRDFISRYPTIEPSAQLHFKAEEFYKNVNAEYPIFAFARHTSRHYSDKHLPIERIRQAVGLAISTPSACNRQHCRVHCVSDKDICEKLLALQKGSRGFGQYVDKLLLVTTDLEDLISPGERLDAFTNGGMFLMNLCYALYYSRVAHCVLNWSRKNEEDMEMRRLIPALKQSESVVAVVACGESPDEFDVAASPRKSISEVFIV